MTPYAILPDDLNQYVSEWKHKRGSLIMVLHAIQDYYGYVPKDVCFTLAKELKIPLARIYEVLTFYHYFTLEEPVKYKLCQCMGTACYLKGAPEIQQAIQKFLNIQDDKKSKNGLFSYETVRCFGCCGLAPVMSINGKIIGNLTPEKAIEVIDTYRK